MFLLHSFTDMMNSNVFVHECIMYLWVCVYIIVYDACMFFCVWKLLLAVSPSSYLREFYFILLTKKEFYFTVYGGAHA